MIRIIDLFVRFLCLFYEVNYRSLERVDNLVHGAIYREWEQYYSVGFCGSVDKSADFKRCDSYTLQKDFIVCARRRMNADLYYVAVVCKQRSRLLLWRSRQGHICQEIILREFLRKLCRIVKAVWLSAIEDLNTHEASDRDSAGNSTNPSQGGASDTSFMWEDMSNYVGRRDRFIRNSGTWNEAKIVRGVDAFKMFFTEEVLEKIICEMKSARATFHGQHSA
jgi:hypothetical protein